MPSFAPWLPGQPPPWLSDPAPAGTDAPAEQDPFLSWVTQGASQPPATYDFTQAEADAANNSPVPPSAFADPLDFSLAESEAARGPVPTVAAAPWDASLIEIQNPPHFDMGGRPDFVFSEDEAANAARRSPPPNFDFTLADSEAARVGLPDVDETDRGFVASRGPRNTTEIGAAPRPPLSPAAPSLTASDTSPEAGLRLNEDAATAASERLVDNTAPTPDEADAQAQEDLAQLYRRDPEAAVRAANDRVMAEETMRATALRKAADDEAMNLENAIKAREQARAKAAASRAQLEQEAQAMAESSPFEAHWASRSTLGKLGGIINGIVGGLMMPSTGGRNSGIDFMLKLADDDAQQKWKSIAARRELAGDAMASAEDDFRMQETIRAANRRSIMGALEAQLANLDPKGSAALRIGESLAALDAANQAAADKYQADAQKQMVEAFKADSERMQAEAQMLNAQSLAAQRAAKTAGRGGGSGGGAAGGWGPKDTRTTAEWSSRYRLPPELSKSLPTGPNGEPVPMTGKEFDEWFEKQKAIGNITAEQEREINTRQGRILEHKKFVQEREINDEGAPLYVYGPDGRPAVDEFGDPIRITANTPPEGAAMRAKVKNTKAAIRLLYEAKAIRKAMSTGESKLPWSDAKKRLDVIAKAIAPLVKEGTEGMSSDADMTNLVGGIGAANLTSFLSQTAAIDQGIAIAHNLLNGSLRTYHYNGPPILVPDPFAMPPPKRDEAVERANARAPQPGFFSRDTWDPTRAFKSHDGVSEKNRSGIDEITARIERGDKPDPNAPGTDAVSSAATLKDLSLSARDGSWIGEAAANPVKQLAASEFWRLKNAGNPAVTAEWDAMSREQRAAMISHLPEEEAVTALRAEFAKAKSLAPKGDK